MTVNEARKLLASRPLKFGDEDQIKAVELLFLAESAEELGLAERPCPECDGDGKKECSECGHYGDCSKCDGDGEVSSKIECADAEQLRHWIEEANEAIAAQT